MKIAYTALLLAVASIANANNLTLNFLQSDDPTDTTVSVFAVVTGDNDGLLNYDIAVNGIDGIDGVASDAISITRTTLNNLAAPTFAVTGFPIANDVDGPSGTDIYSAGGSQFGAANPVVGLGREDVFIEAALGPPNNFDIDVPFNTGQDGLLDSNGAAFTGALGSQLAVLDLGARLSLDVLAGALSGGGTVFAGGDAGTPIALDAPATINVVTPGAAIPEPSTALLAGLGLLGFVARRR